MSAMAGQRQGQAAFAVFCIAAFAAVVVWFGVLRAERQPGPKGSDAGSEASSGPPPNAPPGALGALDAKGTSAPAASLRGSKAPEPAAAPPPQAAPPQAAEGSAPPPAPRADGADAPVQLKGGEAPGSLPNGNGTAAPAPSKAGEAGAEPPAAASAARSDQGAASGEKPAPGDAPPAPSFDIVRVEPTGETVIAGRGPSGATIDMLRDGKPFARVVADSSGLFAIVPPPLPPGSHEIVLQAIAPDGTRARSRDSVTISINEGKTGKPLVALTSPDRPTVLLSTPEPPHARVTEGPPRPPSGPSQPSARGPAPAEQELPQQAAKADASAPKAQAARSTVKIVSVEAGEGGRLYVSGQGAPGATIRLYLNDTLVAPGSAGGDGKVSFAIGRGVRTGDYRVRLDDVDPVSGEVKTRAEVAFAVPAPLTVPLPPQPPPVVTEAPQVAEARPGGTGASSPVGSDSRPAIGAGASGGTSAGAQPSAAASASAAPSPWRDVDPRTVLVPEVNTAIVTRGDSLWRISRRVYGGGVRYTVIYGANQEQIRNPNLIYPGQVFVLPTSPPEPGARDNPQQPKAN